MTIENVLDNGRRVQYVADAVQTEFDYPFSIFDEDDLVVLVDGTPQVIATDYTVDGVGDDNGGAVTFLSGLVGGEIVTIYSDTALERTTDYGQNGPLTSRAINDDFDRLFVVAQELQADDQRALRIPATAEVDDEDIELDPANYAGKYLAFDSDGKPTPAEFTAEGVVTQEIVGRALYPRDDDVEVPASVTPTSYVYPLGDARRYGWSESNTGAQNATALAAAALVWANGGPKIILPAGTFALEEFVVPAGRGLIIEGQGPTQTIIDHSTGGSMFTLGADDIQLFSLRDMTLRPSATTTVLLDWSGDYQAYGFEFSNVELHQGSSGNTTCTAFQIVGGTNAANHQKHYFKWFGAKIFGMGTGIKLDGSVGAAANDFRGYGIQIQGCALDGIWLKDSGCNRFDASIENCGDGATYYNYRITGAVSSENTYIGRLENNGAFGANVPYFIDPAAGVSNYVIATMTATPAGYNTVMAPTGNILLDNGKELSHIERRERGLTRKIGDVATSYLHRFMLATDTMGGIGLYGIRTDGRQSWATGTNPSDWDTHLERVAVGALQARGGVANRMSNSGNVTGSVAPDLSGGWCRRLVLTGDVTIEAPTNPPAGGGIVTFLLIQDGTGGRTVTFNAAFKLAGGAYTMTVTASKRDVISFMYSDTDATYQEVSRSQNQN